jgi:hypothetical protein
MAGSLMHRGATNMSHPRCSRPISETPSILDVTSTYFCAFGSQPAVLFSIVWVEVLRKNKGKKIIERRRSAACFAANFGHRGNQALIPRYLAGATGWTFGPARPPIWQKWTRYGRSVAPPRRTGIETINAQLSRIPTYKRFLLQAQ